MSNLIEMPRKDRDAKLVAEIKTLAYDVSGFQSKA